MNDWYDETYGIATAIFYENIYFIIEGWKKLQLTSLFLYVPLQCECNLQFIVLLIFIDDFCRRVMILLDLHVVQRGSEVGQRIGNPQQYKAAATQGTNAEHSQFMIYIIWIGSVWEGD